MAHRMTRSRAYAGLLGFVALGGISFNALAGPCEFHAGPTNLAVRDGYTEFMPAAVVRPFKEVLPHVERAELDAAMRSEDSMWYDEGSMVFLYQDSVESVVGGRANCVARDVGERNASHPKISKLKNYFGPDYRFRFPFRMAAGTDNVTNVRVLNFWTPPKDSDGRALPVRWWKQSARGRWHWVFPVGTVFGEVMYEQAPNGQWYVFEVRMRKRYLDGWEIDLFRPFLTATAMADEVVTQRPNWQSDAEIARLVYHLRSPNTLTPYRLTTDVYRLAFPDIEGALDKLPDVSDSQLIIRLLTGTTFKSAEGAIWKEHGALETYAPAAEGNFSIVPKGYEIGMVAVNEVSCNRCHDQTGRKLGDFDFDVSAYGEVWGEDRIFTWHMFEPNRNIFGTFDDSDSNTRRPNPRLVRAGLLKNERPAVNDTIYKALPTPF